VIAGVHDSGIRAKINLKVTLEASYLGAVRQCDRQLGGLERGTAAADETRRDIRPIVAAA